MKLKRITICVILAISPLYGEQPTIDSLEQRIKILELQVNELTIELQKSKISAIQAEASTDATSKVIILDLTKQGSIFIEGKEFDEGESSQELKQAATKSPNQSVIIQTSDNTKHQDVLRALEMCKEAKIGNVAFAQHASK